MTWYIDVRHEGLGKYRRVSGRDKFVVEEKARLQVAAWDQQWMRRMESDSKRAERDAVAMDRQSKKEEAAERTSEAQAAVEEIETLLAHTMKVDDRVNWESLKETSPFPGPKPPGPVLDQKTREPNPEDHEFQPQYLILDKLFKSRRLSKDEACRRHYEELHSEWVAACFQIDKSNEARTEQHRGAVVDWERKRDAHLAAQQAHNAQVDLRRATYEMADAEAIVDYCEIVLSNSSYPDWMPRDCDVQYQATTKILLVEFRLPETDDLPKIKEVKFIQSREAMEEVLLPESCINKLYDSLVYQIALRTVHELFEADTIDAIDSVVFNGWVHATDRASGKEVDTCIVSLHANKQDFLAINLANIDPKACFKSLKGVGSAKLHGLTAIAPILSIDRADKRFVDGRSVAGELDEGVNLALMDWQEFEHLVREIFEKELAGGGGEVKVTRASRDGGVDAIAFDPDPIRGGKIVIQAKRYANTVGVSAVRDLYGTVMNEGATKGILVSTSDYGPDAYEFAKGKPLTLLNGGNLLHLLEKHGHRARIDLREAKEGTRES